MFCSKDLLSMLVRLALLASVFITVNAQQTHGYLQGYNPAGVNSPNEGIGGFLYDSAARDLEVDVCVPQPIETFSNGTQVFSEEKYLVILLSQPENLIYYVDVHALNDVASLAYSNSVNCSLSPGSTRSLGNCTIIFDNIIIEQDALLMHCLEYSSNSIDGDVFIDTQNRSTSEVCDCQCSVGFVLGSVFQSFPQPDGTCDGSCSCTKLRQDCSCPAPYNETFVDTWNTLYKNASDTMGENVTIHKVVDVQVLTNCSTPYITYNTTSPTAAPTPEPVPTIAEVICTLEQFTSLCAALTLTGLLPKFENPDGGHTLFAPTNAALEGIGFEDLSILQLTDVLKLHVLPRRVKTFDDLECNKIYSTMLDNESTETVCVVAPESGEADLHRVEIVHKFQKGAGNQGTGLPLPQVSPDIFEQSNGNVLEIDGAILPSTVILPTAAPTAFFNFADYPMATPSSPTPPLPTGGDPTGVFVFDPDSA
eukprot:jgi/Psemu1/328017/estExt_fgenesh1_pg.C_9420002